MVQGFFGGFAGSLRDFLGLYLIFLGLAPFDHLCHLKSGVPPGCFRQNSKLLFTWLVINDISIGFHHKKGGSFLELRFNNQANYWAQLPAAVCSRETNFNSR